MYSGEDPGFDDLIGQFVVAIGVPALISFFGYNLYVNSAPTWAICLYSICGTILSAITILTVVARAIRGKNR